MACPLCRSAEAASALRAGPRHMVRCRQCRLVYRNAWPAAGEGNPNWAWEPLDAGEEQWLGTRRSPIFRRFLDRWEGPPGRLLDVGCGYGWFLQLARERGWTGVGIDISPKAVQYARERLGVDARCGDLKGFRFPDAAFKLVTFWDVLDFVPDPVGLLQETHRVLEPGGRLFIRVPNYLFQRVSFLLTGWLGRPNLTFIFHLTSFTPASLRFLLAQTRFLPLKIGNSRPTYGDPYRAFGGGEWLIAALKVGVYGLVHGIYLLSGGRWVLGPSLEAHARRDGQVGHGA